MIITVAPTIGAVVDVSFDVDVEDAIGSGAVPVVDRVDVNVSDTVVNVSDSVVDVEVDVFDTVVDVFEMDVKVEVDVFDTVVKVEVNVLDSVVKVEVEIVVKVDTVVDVGEIDVVVSVDDTVDGVVDVVVNVVDCQVTRRWMLPQSTNAGLWHDTMLQSEYSVRQSPTTVPVETVGVLNTVQFTKHMAASTSIY